MTARRIRVDPYYNVLPVPGELEAEVGNPLTAVKLVAPAPAKVRQDCSCGLWIESEPDEVSIEHAVQVHQRQPEHRDFVALEQLAGRYAGRQSMQHATYRRLA